MIWVLIGALIALLALAGYRIERLQAEVVRRQAVNHAFAVSLAIDAVSDKTKADALRDAAAAWSTTEGQSERKRLSWTPEVRNAGLMDGRGSLVEVWLRARADKIEGVDRDVAQV